MELGNEKKARADGDAARVAQGALHKNCRVGALPHRNQWLGGQSPPDILKREVLFVQSGWPGLE